MKILVTASTFPRWENDTEPPFVFLLSTHLAQLGHKILVLAPHFKGAKFHEQMENIEVYRFPYFFPFSFQKLCYEGGIVANMKKSILAKLQAPLLCISEFIYMIFLIIKEKPDLIHAHWIVPQGLVGSLVSKLLSIPLAITAHGTDIYSYQKGIFKKLSGFAL